MNHPLDGQGYSFVERLGQGGTAEVARVKIDASGLEAALKYPLESASDQSIDFQKLIDREYDLIGNVAFPGLVRLLPRPEKSQTCLLMEVCSGPALDELGRIDPLPLALNVISAVAADLEFLRAKNIIHGDLKPQNIFLPIGWNTLNEGNLFFAKLSDFSLGRHLDEPEEARAGLGTLGFMAPETIRDSRTSLRTDLFALGTIAYQLLTGRHPFLESDSDPAKVTSRILDEAAPGLDSLRNDLPEDLVTLIHSLLSGEEASRPQSALAVCRQLRDLGATYPFEKILRPGYLIEPGNSYQENIEAVLDSDCPELQRLHELTAEDFLSLRLILTANFNRGNLEYSDGRFGFRSGIYWPACLRNHELRQFASLSWTARKDVIRAALLDDPDAGLSPAARLIRPLLRSSTVRRLSLRKGREAEKAEKYGRAAGFYVQAGLLEQAEACAYQEVESLRKDHHNTEALRLIRKVVDFAELIDQQHAVRQLILLRGHILKENGEMNEAQCAYDDIVKICSGHSDDRLLAETYKNLGDLYKLKQEVKNGIESLEVALRIYTELDDQLEISHTLNNIANMHWIGSNMGEALRTYRAALHIQRGLKVDADIASSLTNIGGLYCVTGRIARGIRIMLMSLELKKEIGHLGEIARTLNNLGFAHVLLSDFPKAVEYLSESLEANRRIGSQKEILTNLSNLTEVMVRGGQLRKSLKYLREARELADDLGDLTVVTESQRAIGEVLRRTGSFAEAMSALNDGEEALKKIDSQRDVALYTLERARIRQYLGDIKSASKMAQEALEEAREIKDFQTLIESLLTLVGLTRDKEYLDQVLEITQKKDMERENKLARFELADSHLENGSFQEAFKALDDVLELPLQWKEDIELPWMCNVAAEVLVQADRSEEARPYLSRSERLARNDSLKPELANALILKGQISFGAGDYEQTYAYYREALTIFKSIADTISDTADRQTFQKKRSIQFLTVEIRRLSELLTRK